MRRYLSILFIHLLFALPLYAGKTKPAKIPAKIKLDTASLSVRNLDTNKIKNYLADTEFRYNKADLPGESLWDRFWHWFWHWLNNTLFTSPGTRDAFYYFFLAAGFVFIVFVLYKVIGINRSFIFRGGSKNVAMAYSESLEDIHRINFDSEIEKAINNRNYRLAVRLLYLHSLKQLNDAQFINWQIEKTNTAYLNEIPEGEKRKLFSLLTYQFEYIWYGNFHIDGQSFQTVSNLFDQLKQQLR
jgi:hypothetical protein